MLKKIFSITTIFILLNVLYAQDKPKLLFYCGITMVKPMEEIAKIIEKKYNCNISIIQGGSEGLYQSLKFAKKGDMYLPGSQSYRKKHLNDGYLLDNVYIGFNQAAVFVQKGNPKNIKNLDSLVREDVRVIICDPDTGSIGKMTKKIITNYKGEDFYFDISEHAIEIGTDSRNLNESLKNNQSDTTINWRATAFFDDNKKYIDIVQINEKYAPKKKLVLNLLKFSKHPEIVKNFMEYCVSNDGQIIMKKYGFLD